MPRQRRHRKRRLACAGGSGVGRPGGGRYRARLSLPTRAGGSDQKHDLSGGGAGRPRRPHSGSELGRHPRWRRRSAPAARKRPLGDVEQASGEGTHIGVRAAGAPRGRRWLSARPELRREGWAVARGHRASCAAAPPHGGQQEGLGRREAHACVEGEEGVHARVVARAACHGRGGAQRKERIYVIAPDGLPAASPTKTDAPLSTRTPPLQSASSSQKTPGAGLR